MKMDLVRIDLSRAFSYCAALTTPTDFWTIWQWRETQKKRGDVLWPGARTNCSCVRQRQKNISRGSCLLRKIRLLRIRTFHNKLTARFLFFRVAKTTPSFFWFLSRRFAEATTLRLTTLTATLTLRNRPWLTTDCTTNYEQPDSKLKRGLLELRLRKDTSLTTKKLTTTEETATTPPWGVARVGNGERKQ